MHNSYKSKLIQQHIAQCQRNGVVLSQAELNRLYSIPYRFLKKFIAQAQSEAEANA
jgi:hypothetical protein